MTRALVVHPGTQHSADLARELERLDALAGFHTGFVAGDGGGWARHLGMLGFPLRRKLSKRRARGVPASKTHLQIGLELASQAFRALGHDGQAHFHWRNERFQRAVPDRAISEADVVIGFDTSSWILAERCRALRRPLIMVRTIGHPDANEAANKLLASQFPDWAETAELRLPQVRQAEQIEFDEASLIVGSSRFTHDTLVAHGVASDKIRIIPHGVDIERFSVGPTRRNRPFRFIFVGSLSSRKGIPLLLDVWRRMVRSDAELWLVGSISTKVRTLLPDLPGMRVWGHVPGHRVPDMLQQCDVFVFPSYFEGFGLVILQAMACGLPVISSQATAAPDLIGAPGNGGWILPTGQQEALEQTMAYCCAHQDEMLEIGRIARSIAERHSWQAYGRNWLPVLKEAVARNSLSTAPSPIKARAWTSGHEQVLLSHPGTQYSYHLAMQLQLRGRLTRFYTGFAIRNGSIVGRACDALPEFARNRLSARRLDGLPREKLRIQPLGELRYMLREQFAGLGTEMSLHRRNEEFQRSIPARDIRQSNVVVGFDTSSWLLARRVKQMNGKFVLDQSIGHPIEKEKIFRALRDRFPEWSITVPRKADAHIAEEMEEHTLADLVVVPSSFVGRTLTAQGVPEAKIRVIPFGTDLSCFHPAETSRTPGPVVFLFVGSISARKGVPILLEAWRQMRASNAELWLVGPGAVRKCAAFDVRAPVRFLGRRSRSDVAELMRRADVLVFPSFFEGLAQVQLEALASGLPLISTIEAGAEDLIRNGQNGFLVPAGDVTALSERMLQVAADQDLITAMRRTVIEARARLSWSVYGDRWVKVLDELV
jgi:alpha-maltose-1-phosphate synthase